MSFYLFAAWKRRKGMSRTNKTKELLAQSLTELMVTTPLEKISVNDIVEHAGVGRNTFYYHFEDKFDLVNWYFQSGATQFLVTRGHYASWSTLLTDLEEYLLQNKTFYVNALAYTGQIYFDFSAYSDMAIGLGKMLGFDFNKNFDYPYISTSVSEFWRRWHISLGSWFRDYIYIPLGGNRVSTLKHIRNILVVWALTGLWHGASWNFVLWGVYYGLFLLLEKFVLQKYLKKIPSWLCTVYTMLVVMIGWVFFSQTDFGALGHYLGTMFGIGASGFIDKTALYYLKTGFILLLISILMCRPAPYQYFKRLVRRRPVAAVIINLILFALSIAYMVYNSYTPFLYAKF